MDIKSHIIKRNKGVIEIAQSTLKNKVKGAVSSITSYVCDGIKEHPVYSTKEEARNALNVLLQVQDTLSVDIETFQNVDIEETLRTLKASGVQVTLDELFNSNCSIPNFPNGGYVTAGCITAGTIRC